MDRVHPNVDQASFTHAIMGSASDLREDSVAQTTICYCIDENDCISSVNQAWNRSAIENDGQALIGDQLIGTSLWTFITNPETQHLYRIMLRKVRAGTPIRLQLRCDNSTHRQTIEIAISLLPEGQVRFESSICAETLRHSVALLDPTSQRSNALLVQCSWCNKIQLPNAAWVEVEIAVERLLLFESVLLPQLTHGVCKTCETNLLLDLENLA